MPRVNGTIGLESDLDPSAWKLEVAGAAGDQARRSLTLDDIKALPRVDTTTELRCIEGWSEVVYWAGARLADLATVTGLATRSGRPADPTGNADDLLDYVALETPDREYYVGLDMASALHPQTLLWLRDGRSALDPGTRRSAPPGHPGQVRHQEPQADRHDSLHRLAARRLLGRTRL
jgi:DMSO/TMAO reductase YedYZ molybdopterin-dependent catalytic subunit